MIFKLQKKLDFLIQVYLIEYKNVKIILAIFIVNYLVN